MTPFEARLREIRERLERATPGPWLDSYGEPAWASVMEQDREEDDLFIAHSRTDLPWALDKLEAAVKLLRSIEGPWPEREVFLAALEEKP